MNNLKNPMSKEYRLYFWRGKKNKTQRKVLDWNVDNFLALKKKESDRLSAWVSHTIIKVELIFSPVSSTYVNPSHCLSIKG